MDRRLRERWDTQQQQRCVEDAAGERSVQRSAGFAFLSGDSLTQGRLAEARLTLGYLPQPIQGWYVAA